MSKQYLALLPIEAMPLGTIYAKGEQLPLHCTLMPWFCFGGWAVSERVLAAQIRESVRDVDTLVLVSEKPALYGPNRDIPVHELVENQWLRLAHLLVFRLLKAQGALFQDEGYVGDNFSAHVTDTARKFLPGMQHAVTEFVLIAKDEKGSKEVIQTSYL